MQSQHIIDIAEHLSAQIKRAAELVVESVKCLSFDRPPTVDYLALITSTIAEIAERMPNTAAIVNSFLESDGFKYATASLTIGITMWVLEKAAIQLVSFVSLVTGRFAFILGSNAKSRRKVEGQAREASWQFRVYIEGALSSPPLRIFYGVWTLVRESIMKLAFVQLIFGFLYGVTHRREFDWGYQPFIKNAFLYSLGFLRPTRVARVVKCIRDYPDVWFLYVPIGSLIYLAWVAYRVKRKGMVSIIVNNIVNIGGKDAEVATTTKYDWHEQMLLLGEDIGYAPLLRSVKESLRDFLDFGIVSLVLTITTPHASIFSHFITPPTGYPYGSWIIVSATLSPYVLITWVISKTVYLITCLAYLPYLKKRMSVSVPMIGSTPFKYKGMMYYKIHGYWFNTTKFFLDHIYVGWRARLPLLPPPPPPIVGPHGPCPPPPPGPLPPPDDGLVRDITVPMRDVVLPTYSMHPVRDGDVTTTYVIRDEERTDTEVILRIRNDSYSSVPPPIEVTSVDEEEPLLPPPTARSPRTTTASITPPVPKVVTFSARTSPEAITTATADRSMLMHPTVPTTTTLPTSILKRPATHVAQLHSGMIGRKAMLDVDTQSVTTDGFAHLTFEQLSDPSNITANDAENIARTIGLSPIATNIYTDLLSRGPKFDPIQGTMFPIELAHIRSMNLEEYAGKYTLKGNVGGVEVIGRVTRAHDIPMTPQTDNFHFIDWLTTYFPDYAEKVSKKTRVPPTPEREIKEIMKFQKHAVITMPDMTASKRFPDYSEESFTLDYLHRVYGTHGRQFKPVPFEAIDPQCFKRMLKKFPGFKTKLAGYANKEDAFEYSKGVAHNFVSSFSQTHKSPIDHWWASIPVPKAGSRKTNKWDYRCRSAVCPEFWYTILDYHINKEWMDHADKTIGNEKFEMFHGHWEKEIRRFSKDADWVKMTKDITDMGASIQEFHYYYIKKYQDQTLIDLPGQEYVRDLARWLNDDCENAYIVSSRLSGGHLFKTAKGQKDGRWQTGRWDQFALHTTFAHVFWKVIHTDPSFPHDALTNMIGPDPMSWIMSIKFSTHGDNDLRSFHPILAPFFEPKLVSKHYAEIGMKLKLEECHSSKDMFTLLVMGYRPSKIQEGRSETIVWDRPPEEYLKSLAYPSIFIDPDDYDYGMTANKTSYILGILQCVYIMGFYNASMRELLKSYRDQVIKDYLYTINSDNNNRDENDILFPRRTKLHDKMVEFMMLDSDVDVLLNAGVTPDDGVIHALITGKQLKHPDRDAPTIYGSGSAYARQSRDWNQETEGGSYIPISRMAVPESSYEPLIQMPLFSALTSTIRSQYHGRSLTGANTDNNNLTGFSFGTHRYTRAILNVVGFPTPPDTPRVTMPDKPTMTEYNSGNYIMDGIQWCALKLEKMLPIGEEFFVNNPLERKGTIAFWNWLFADLPTILPSIVYNIHGDLISPVGYSLTFYALIILCEELVMGISPRWKKGFILFELAVKWLNPHLPLPVKISTLLPAFFHYRRSGPLPVRVMKHLAYNFFVQLIMSAPLYIGVYVLTEGQFNPWQHLSPSECAEMYNILMLGMASAPPNQ